MPHHASHDGWILKAYAQIRHDLEHGNESRLFGVSEDATNTASITGSELAAAASAKKVGCYATPADEAPFLNCQCHPSCRACGYNDAPTGDIDCISCPKGFKITPVYADGSGTCDADGADVGVA